MTVTREARFAAEGGNLYDVTGRQVATVDGTEKIRGDDGVLRPKQIKPDIRHARKLDLAPGVTTIIRQAHRQQLQDWIVEQAIYSALTFPNKDGLVGDELIEAIVADSREQVAKAAEVGTAIHATLSSALLAKDIIDDADYMEPRALAGFRALTFAFGVGAGWSSETGVSHRYGYGTKVDLHLRLPDGRLVIGDIKTKDTPGDVEAARLYDDHYMQLGAGFHALAPEHMEQASANGFILFVSRTLDADGKGRAVVVSAAQDRLDRGWRKFKALLRYWQEHNEYRPSWAKEIP